MSNRKLTVLVLVLVVVGVALLYSFQRNLDRMTQQSLNQNPVYQTAQSLLATPTRSR